VIGRHPLTRSIGAADWPLGVLLGTILGAVLMAGVILGRGPDAARVGLGIILVALPTVPRPLGVGLRTLAARTAAMLTAAVGVDLLHGEAAPVAVLVVLAAGVGAFLPRVRVAGALAGLLCGLQYDIAGAATIPGAGEALGALTVVAAAALSAGCARHPSRRPAAAPDTVGGGDASAADTAGRREKLVADAWHSIRMTASVGSAIGAAELSGLGMYGGHWLVTAVLLSVQRTGSATRLRVTQRLVGNTGGALLVAVLMAAGPAPGALAAVTAVLFCVAFAVRPINYLWWAVTAPPVLLIVGDFPHTHDWYEGAVRVALGMAGAVIVIGIFWLTPDRAPWSRLSPGSSSG
jgi:hypothetical protein